MLGVLKAGKFYVLLEPSYPPPEAVRSWMIPPQR
jgi:hypothetical protein